jgi:hypothetical protein
MTENDKHPSLLRSGMEQCTFKNVNSRWNTKCYFYIEPSGGQNSNLYSNVHFLTPVLFRHQWQLKAVVFLRRCLIRAVILVTTVRSFIVQAPNANLIKLFYVTT